MTEKRARNLETIAAAERPEPLWIVRDRNGRRVLGTAPSLHAAIKHAVKRGELYPLLEQLGGPNNDSPGPVMWRRTL